MGRTYAIADVHGNFDLLCKAISLTEAHAGDAEGNTLVILGDFVDRGPHTASIIDLLSVGPSLHNWRWIVLQGNHEAMMLAALADPARYLKWWIGNGGGATLLSFGYVEGDTIFPLKVPQWQLDWLECLPLWHQDDHRIYVHAGVPFDQTLTRAKRESLQWMLYPGDVEHGEAEFHPDERHCSGKHIVHGHHQSASHPLLKPHRTNLDSFAWSTGRLAVGVFDDARPGGPVEILEALRT